MKCQFSVILLRTPLSTHLINRRRPLSPSRTATMATQSGITISAPNAPHLITNDVPVPSLGSKKALVKSLYTGINPV